MLIAVRAATSRYALSSNAARHLVMERPAAMMAAAERVGPAVGLTSASTETAWLVSPSATARPAATMAAAGYAVPAGKARCATTVSVPLVSAPISAEAATLYS